MGVEWVSKEGVVQISPNGARIFLAGLREKGARFRQDQLPAHKVVHLEFDLIVRGSWDGGSGPGHHDRAIVELEDGRRLLESSFRTYDHGRDKQSYPFHYNSGRVTTCHFGAAEQHSLGYLWTYSSDEQWKADTIYHMDWYVPHEGKDFGCSFYTRLGEDDQMQDMWIGLDRMKISVLAEEEVYAEGEWKRLAAQVEGADAITADKAVWQMLRSPTQARKWLGDEEGKVMEVVDKNVLAGLITGLGDESLTVRRRAAEEMMGFPREALAQLGSVHDKMKDEKVRERLQRIMEAVRSQAPKRKDDYWRKRLRELLDPPVPEEEEEEDQEG